MSDTTYRVVVDLSTRGSLDSAVGSAASSTSKLSSAVGGATSGVSALGSAFASMGSRVAGALSSAIEHAERLAIGLAKMGAVAVVGGAIYGVASLNRSLQETQISLGTILTMNGQSSTFGDGFARAGGLMKELRKDAGALPGTFEDLVGMFNQMSVPGFQAGMDPEKMRTFSKETMAAAKALGIPFEQAGREMAMLMEGRAGAHNVFGMLLGGLGGDKAKAFNKEDGTKRVADLTAMIDSPAIRGAMDKYKTSFSGVTTTLLSNMKEFGALATAPLFDRVTRDLGRMNDWLDANKDKVESLANVIGGRLVQVWDAVADKVKWLGAHFDGLTAKVEKFTMKEGLGKVAGEVGLFEAGKVGLKMAPSMLGGLSSLAGPAAGAAGVSGAALGGGAAAGAAGFAVAAGGAFDILTDKSSTFHRQAVSDFAAVEEAFKLVTTAGEPLHDALKFGADFMGASLLGTLHILSNVLGEMSSQASAAIGVFKAIPDALTSVATGVAGQLDNLASGIISLGPASDTAASGIESLLATLGNALKRTRLDTQDDAATVPDRNSVAGAFHAYAFIQAGAAAAVTAEKAKLPPGGGGGGGGTHIQKVEIVVNQNDDPSRVARKVVDIMADMKRFPTASRNVPNFSASR